MIKATAIATGIASLVVFALVAQAQEFDATHCYMGTFTLVFASEDATVVNFEHKGIYQSNGKRKTLHGFSIHCAGTAVTLNKKEVVRGGCKVLDPQGKDNSIFLVFDRTGGDKVEGTATAVAGTGAWKGVTGGGNWLFHTRGKSFAPGTYQNCMRYYGKFTVPKSK